MAVALVAEVHPLQWRFARNSRPSLSLCAPADTLIMYQVPSSSDVAGRRALRRLQEVRV